MAATAEEVKILLKIDTNLNAIRSASTEFSQFFGQLKAGFNLNIGSKVADTILSIPRAAISATREYMRASDELVREIERTRTQTGLAAEASQTFFAILRAGNQDVGALTPALNTLSRFIGDALSGDTGNRSKLAIIGENARDLKGLAPERQLERIAVALSRLTDEDQRNALSADLLGKNYAALKPIIEGLSTQGYDRLQESVRATNGLIDDGLSRSIDAAGNRGQAAGNRIATAFAGTVLKVKELTAVAKEALADIIAGPVTPVGSTREQTVASLANADTAGKTIAQLEKLVQNENKILDYIGRITDLTAIGDTRTQGGRDFADALQRLKIYEAALAAANARAEEAGIQAAEQFAEGDQVRSRNRVTQAQRTADLIKRIQGDVARVGGQVDTEFDRRDTDARAAADAKLGRELAAIEQQRARIEGDRFTTAIEKQRLLQPLYEREQQLIANRVRLLTDELALTQDQAAQQAIQARIDQLSGQSAGITTQQTTTAPLSLTDQFDADLTSLQDRFGTTTQAISRFITDGIGTAIQGVSDGIYGLITGTATWGQVGLQAGAQILKSLIDIGVQQTVMFVRGLFQTKANVATQATAGASIASSNAPAAAATSISSYGAAAAIGTAAAIAGIAAIIALISGGFAEGGYTGPGAKYQPAGIVHAGEYVMPAHVVQRLGLANMQAIHHGRGYADGGLVTVPQMSAASGRPASTPSAASSQPAPRIFFDLDALKRDIFNSGEFNASVHHVLRQSSR
jgi:hypothetical protein